MQIFIKPSMMLPKATDVEQINFQCSEESYKKDGKTNAFPLRRYEKQNSLHDLSSLHSSFRIKGTNFFFLFLLFFGMRISFSVLLSFRN